MTGSWLSGPTAALPKRRAGAEPDKYRGESLGLPESGVGSLASTGRRVAALLIDWLLCVGVAAALLGGNALSGAWSTMTLLIWLVVGVGAVTVSSFTPGQFFAGISVTRIDGPVKVGFVRALARSVLLFFVVPAVITDADGRGMHDRATGTALVLAR